MEDEAWAEHVRTRTRRLVVGVALFALACFALGELARACGFGGDHEPWRPKVGPPPIRK